MRCSQLETRLNDLLDRREDPSTDAEITAHTAHCRRCRRVTAAYTMLADGAAALADDADACETLHETDVRPSPRFGVLRGTVLRSTVAVVWTTAAAMLLYFTTTPVANHSADQATVAPSPIRPSPLRPVPAMIELTQSTGRLYVDLLYGTARGVDGALSLATSVPPANELLEPVLYADGTLLKQLNDEWLPAADATLDALEQAFAEDAPVKS